MIGKMWDRIARWRVDDDGDLTLSFCGVLHFTFYKWPNPVVRYGRKGWRGASKADWRSISLPRVES